MRTLSNGVPPGVVIPPGRFRMPSFGHGPATRFRRGSSAVCSVIIPPRPSPPSTASVVIARAWSTACGCQNLSASSLNVKSDESCDENVHCTPEPLWWNDWRGDKARRAGGGGDGAAFRRETAVVSLCREGKQTPFRAHRARAIRPSRRSAPFRRGPRLHRSRAAPYEPERATTTTRTLISKETTSRRSSTNETRAQRRTQMVESSRAATR